ncbi:putative phosphoenolpyruvate synthase [Schistocerca gregaria]|uniref:putative phosphoenolpyruvate synthase n=1 Tax=Schistocerca gregaria TaxID=7010 RepID=UPI00211E0F15|nr:putative phosphoenolpyruvate synthase [Schistocerca gregaria]
MDWFWNLALFSLPLVGFSLFSKLVGGTEKIHGIYSKPEWNFILKKWYAFLCLTRRKRKILDKFSNNIFASIEEEAVENPQHLPHEESIDSRSFIGCDVKGNAVWLKIVRKNHRSAELWIHLHLSNGAIYQLPCHPHTLTRSDTSNTWSGGGLKFQICEPFMRWRITFNGLLRQGVQGKLMQNEDSAEHVRFRLLWKACSNPFELPGDISTKMLAEAVAREPWRSGDWLSMLDELGDGYEQWGMFFGTVETEEGKLHEIHMQSLNKHHWGLNPAVWQHRRITFNGVTKEGFMFTLTAVSSIEGVTHATFGHVRLPNGKQLPVNWCDLRLPNIAEHPKCIPDHYVFRFSAGKKNFTTVVDFIPKGKAVFYSGYPWESQTHIRTYQFLLNDKSGAGTAEFWYRYDGDCPDFPVSLSDHLLEPEVEGSHMVVTFSDRECQSSAIVGGKGASLALLSSAACSQFQVPSGFCLTTHAFDYQLHCSPDLKNEINKLNDMSSECSPEELKTQCERISGVFEKTSICDEVRQEVLKVLSQFDVSVRYAVRSSAVGEDSEDLSAAGQNATFLGLMGESNILLAIQKCWGSLYMYQSVQYRRQNGQPINTNMGVVVQQMIPADVAGVMFTCHPVTGNPKEVLITANYGLGESVVSASADPDTIILTRNGRDKLSLKSSVPGKKKHRIDMNDSTDGTVTTEIAVETLVNELCLSPDEAVALGKIGIQLESMFGSARDIEWAIYKGIIYILQARPVTALHSWSDFELLHELDSPVASEEEFFTTANLGEVFPEGTSPLSQSFVIPLLNNGMKKVMRSYYLDQLHLSHHHAFMNVLNVILREPEADISIANKATELAVFGHSILTPQMHRIAKERHGTPNITRLYDYIKRVVFNKGELKKALKLQDEFKLKAKHLNTLELYNKIRNDAFVLQEVIKCHSNTSQVSVISQIVSMIVLTERSKDISVDHASDISLFLSQCCDVLSAEIPVALKEIGHDILSTGRGDEFCSLPPPLAVEWLDLNSGKVRQKYNDFLLKHGHRSIQEFDLATETWSMRPLTIIETLQSIVKQGRETSKELNQKTTNAADVIRGLISVKQERTRKILSWLLPWCQKSVAIRETTKACVIKVLHQFRLAFRDLGQLMVKESRLPDAELVFYMTFYELGYLLNTRDPVIVNKAVMRKRHFPKWSKLRFPEIISGLPVPVNENQHDFEHQLSDAETVQGTPVTQGNACGRACVVPHLNQISQLQPGDILITQCTDIGWTPYFPLLAGVVTEIGGLISHGAVIAREYGLPCIVGVQNATKLFKTGDIVLLAATSGTLRKVAEGES